MNWILLGIAVVVVSAPSAFAADIGGPVSDVEYVKCATRTNADPDNPTKPPPASWKKLRLDGELARELAIYQGDFGPAVLAPRGWRCELWGSGSVTRLSISPADDVTGQVVKLEIFDSESSGRYSAAKIIGPLFPQYREFVDRVQGAEAVPPDMLRFEVPKSDVIRRTRDTALEFTTPPNSEGLGTFDDGLKPTANEISGLVAVNWGNGSALQVTLLRIRMGRQLDRLRSSVVEFTDRSLVGTRDVFSSVSEREGVDWQQLSGEWGVEEGCRDRARVSPDGSWQVRRDGVETAFQYVIYPRRNEVCVGPANSEMDTCLSPDVLSDVKFEGTQIDVSLDDDATTKTRFAYRRCAVEVSQSGEPDNPTSQDVGADQTSSTVRVLFTNPLVGWIALILALLATFVAGHPSSNAPARVLAVVGALASFGVFAYQRDSAFRAGVDNSWERGFARDRSVPPLPDDTIDGGKDSAKLSDASRYAFFSCTAQFSLLAVFQTAVSSAPGAERANRFFLDLRKQALVELPKIAAEAVSHGEHPATLRFARGLGEYVALSTFEKGFAKLGEAHAQACGQLAIDFDQKNHNVGAEVARWEALYKAPYAEYAFDTVVASCTQSFGTSDYDASSMMPRKTAAQYCEQAKGEVARMSKLATDRAIVDSFWRACTDVARSVCYSK